jgi:hypothetical protein
MLPTCLASLCKPQVNNTTQKCNRTCSRAMGKQPNKRGITAVIFIRYLTDINMGLQL